MCIRDRPCPGFFKRLTCVEQSFERDGSSAIQFANHRARYLSEIFALACDAAAKARVMILVGCEIPADPSFQHVPLPALRAWTYLCCLPGRGLCDDGAIESFSCEVNLAVPQHDWVDG